MESHPESVLKMGQSDIRWAPIYFNSGSNRKPINWGFFAISIYILEALIAKSRIFVSISTSYHMVASAVLILTLFIMGLSYFHNSRNQTINNLRGIRIAVGLLIGWGFISSIFQSFLVANLLFWLLWAGNYYISFWSIPKLLIKTDIQKRLNLISFLLLVSIVPSFFIPLETEMTTPTGPRFGGIFGNASMAGDILAMTIAWYFSLRLTSTWRRKWQIPFIIISAVFLVMSRTRAAIASAIIGSFAAILTSIFSSFKKIKRIAFNTIIFLVILCIAGGFVLTSDLFKEGQISEYLRTNGGAQRIYQGRAYYWERGVNDYWSFGLFGKGFMSKFGDVDHSTKYMGISVPSYDWNTNADPLNSFLLMSQQLGIPAGFIYLFFVFSIWKAGRNLASENKIIFSGIFFVGLVFSVQNWLVSFGHPPDRIFLFAFSALLSLPNNKPFLPNNTGILRRQG